MRAGSLDRTITLERKNESIAHSGAVACAWTILATVRAELVEASADEAAIGYGEAETATRLFRIRWIPSVEITTDDRLTYAGAAYDIRAVVEIGRRRALDLRCERIRQ
jgi:SPP1 family predicted phage head-tail adaptor